MKDIKEYVEQSKILELKTGSHLYGLTTEGSDLDLGGVFIEPKEYIIPNLIEPFLLSPFRKMKTVEEVDCGVKSKLENGKNAPDAIDRKFYALKKFFKLASENNPNIIEFLFANKESIVFINKYGQMLLDNANIFLHKGLFNRFVGYSFSQEKKMYIKSENITKLKNTLSILEKQTDKNMSLDHLSLENSIDSTFYIKKHSPTNEQLMFKVGDLEFGAENSIKYVIERLTSRLSSGSQYRQDFVFKKGYDYKFGSHVVRLLNEGIDLLEKGKIEFPLRNKDIIMDIKLGNVSLEDLQHEISKLRLKIAEISEVSNLPSKPKINEIEELLFEIQRDFYGIKDWRTNV